MTWIVGRALPWGCAAALSDIRVTLADRSEVDCLQKIYPVGRFIALGFAGSVAIGFGMVGRLRQLLGTVKPGEAWEPDVVAEWWPEQWGRVLGHSVRLPIQVAGLCSTIGGCGRNRLDRLWRSSCRVLPGASEAG